MTGERWGFALFAGLVLVLLMNSILVSANPDIMYESDPFIINEWNQEDLLRIANESGYAIKIEVEPLVCRDENWTLYEGGNCAGRIPVSGPVYEYINSNKNLFSFAEKKMGINPRAVGLSFETGSILIKNHTFNLKFYADGFTYISFGLCYQSTNYEVKIYEPLEQIFDLQSTKQMIENELKKFDFVDNSFSLKLTAKEYSPARLQENSGTGYTDNTVIIISGIIIIAIIVGIAIYRRK